MKVKDWQKATQLVQERQSQAVTTDTSELSSFSFSELPVDQSGPKWTTHHDTQAICSLINKYTSSCAIR